MRPEEKWNKANPPQQGPRRTRASKKKNAQKASTAAAAAAAEPKSRDNANMQSSSDKVTVVGLSSPSGSDSSSPPVDDNASPGMDSQSNNKVKDGGDQETTAAKNQKRQGQGSAGNRRENQGPFTSEATENGSLDQGTIETLQRAIQSSPARSMKMLRMALEAKDEESGSTKSLTPKPVRRALFPTSGNKNSPAVSSREASGPSSAENEKRSKGSSSSCDKENQAPPEGSRLEAISITSTPRRKRCTPRASPRGMPTPDGLDRMFMNVFQEGGVGSDLDSFYPSEASWIDLFQTSPIRTQRGGDAEEDFIRAIMSEPDMRL